MKFKVLTLFPDLIQSLYQYSVLGKAIENKTIELEIIDIRDYSTDRHKRVDDEIYGGGAGMLMTCQPIVECIESVNKSKAKVLFMSPQGKVLTQDICKDYSKEEELIILCGHYEGVDARVIHHWVDEEVSIGDYVMTGGELGAMVLIDSVSRMVEKVLGNENSAKTDSHYNLLLQEDCYTRPRSFRGYEVPEVLFGGNHKMIEQWKIESSVKNTKIKRKDIYNKYIEKIGGKHGYNQDN